MRLAGKTGNRELLIGYTFLYRLTLFPATHPRHEGVARIAVSLGCGAVSPIIVQLRSVLYPSHVHFSHPPTNPSHLHPALAPLPTNLLYPLREHTPPPRRDRREKIPTTRESSLRLPVILSFQFTLYLVLLMYSLRDTLGAINRPTNARTKNNTAYGF